MGDTKTTKIRNVTVNWADDTETKFVKMVDGSWKAEGIQPQGPKGMLDHIGYWVESSYKEDNQ